MACVRCGSEIPEDARFCPVCGADQTEGAPQEERKVVSILFVDVVGSTAHADGADPEDVRERNQLYYQETRARIERYGGVVEKYIGDAVMAVFGAPLARSDDAERAVRAALAVLEGVRELNERHAGLDLEVRVAVGSGEAMVALNAAPGDALATGDVVNTAARLESAAPPGRAIVGEETYRLTRHAFSFEELDRIQAKGKRETVAAWLVGEPLVAPANRPTSRTPLVGRDRELLMIRTVWDRAMNASRPHLVTVLGPAGIGKSRLALEAAAEIEGQGGRVLWGRSLPYEEQTPYRGMGEIVRVAAGIFENDAVDVARAKLAAAVEALFPPAESAEVTRYLSLLLGLGLDEPASEVIHLQFATRRFVEHLSEREPLMLVFEDVHWADEVLLDLIEYLVTHVSDHRILFVALARPEFLEGRPTWGAGMAGTTMLPLDPLTASEASEVIGSLLDSARATTIERVVATAGGNPLFIEELVASLADDPLSEELPGTVRAAISARIDALPPAGRTALLHASVIGQTFWRDVLADIGDLEDVDEALEMLEARGLVQRRSQSQVEDDVEFAFKHVLIRDTAYGTLPRAARRQLHAATAAHLERTLPDPAEVGWILAYHWREAGEPAKAIAYLLGSAKRTADALAIEDTWDLYTRALDLAATDEERRAIRLKRGLAMADLEDYSRAKRELGELAPELTGRDLIEALIAQGHSTTWTEDSDATIEIATRAVELAEAAGDDELLPPALALLSGGYGMRGEEGDLHLAVETGERGMSTWVPGTRTALARRGLPHAGQPLVLAGALRAGSRVLAPRGRGLRRPAERGVPAARRGHEGAGALGPGPLRGGADGGRDRHLDRERDGPAGERRDELLDRTAARHLRRRRGPRAQLGGRRPARALGLQHAVDQRARRRDRRRPDPGRVRPRRGRVPGDVRGRDEQPRVGAVARQRAALLDPRGARARHETAGGGDSRGPGGRWTWPVSPAGRSTR